MASRLRPPPPPTSHAAWNQPSTVPRPNVVPPWRQPCGDHDLSTAARQQSNDEAALGTFSFAFGRTAFFRTHRQGWMEKQDRLPGISLEVGQLENDTEENCHV